MPLDRLENPGPLILPRLPSLGGNKMWFIVLFDSTGNDVHHRNEDPTSATLRNPDILLTMRPLSRGTE
jgi:hypothetical protein